MRQVVLWDTACNFNANALVASLASAPTLLVYCTVEWVVDVL